MWRKLAVSILPRLETVPGRDGQTDGQTELLQLIRAIASCLALARKNTYNGHETSKAELGLLLVLQEISAQAWR